MLAPGADGRSVQGWATAERMIADMDAAGIDRVELTGSRGQSAQTDKLPLEDSSKGLAGWLRHPARPLSRLLRN